jgi:hypothetical protein
MSNMGLALVICGGVIFGSHLVNFRSTASRICLAMSGSVVGSAA